MPNSQKVFDSHQVVEGYVVPPLEAALPERGPRENAFDWVARCGEAAVNAALGKLATEEGWDIAPLEGDPRGWRVRDPHDPERKWINIFTGKRTTPMPSAVPWDRR